MRKYAKYICGILTAAMMTGGCLQWPVTAVFAAEDPGQGILREESGQGITETAETEEDGGTVLEGETGNAPEEDPGAAEATQGEGTTQGGARTSGNLDEETAQYVEEAGEALAAIAAERDIMALVYLSDTYPIRTSPSQEGGVAVTVLSGQTVNILDIYVDDEFEIWHYVSLDYKGQEIRGYVPRANLACSDERFLAWEEQCGMGHTAYAVDNTSAYADIEAFPESYRPALQALKQKHPNWTFVVMNTNLDWETSIRSELQGGKSLVHKSLPDCMKEGLYDTGSWYYASEAALKLYMDPRNGLSENAVFQFEQLTYNEKYHTQAAVTSFLDGANSFMKSSGVAPGTNRTFADLFYSIGVETGVSPFHLAARVLQEQGNGTSPLISGNYPGYEGYYNYFNINASGKTNEEVYRTGLQYAKNQNPAWTDAEKSIRGGAAFLSANYIKKGQDTLYLQKFNVNPNAEHGVYTHQYMQNISAPTSEAGSVRKQYETAKALESPFVFKIPVYKNMPAAACSMPTVSTNVALKLPSGYSDTAMWLDGVAYTGEIRNGHLIAAAPDGNAKTAVMYKYDASGVPVGMYVWSLSYSGTAYTATAQPELADLLTYHGFAIRITGKSGIRFTSGISTELRAKLTTTGVNGYKLQEYGTLVMNQANMSQYPMVKGGTKVASGISYGRDANGNLQDVVSETTEGRYRFTSVLVGLPVEQYKTEFAFRGYVILEKNGAQTVVYGPVKSYSIYNLAKVLLGKGSYQQGSSAYQFLEKIVSDADALKN